jgi:outer membrane receptor for ferrienterochelin and colicins
VIPSINTKFALTKTLDLRLAYARGFRSPSLRELYFNFFDANHQIVGNPDLKAETSNSFTGSLAWKTFSAKNTTVGITLSGFYNNVHNLIDYAVSGSNPNLFILTNVFNSKTAGGSLNATAACNHLTASLGLAYTGFYNDYAEADKSLPELQWSPEVNSNISYSFSKAGLDVNLFYKFTGKRPFYVASGQQYLLSKRNSYSWADFTVNKKLFALFTVNAGIRNLFNVKGVNSQVTGSSVHGSSGVMNIGYGRSYFAGLAFNWNKK